jgi:hypothetical protein
VPLSAGFHILSLSKDGLQGQTAVNLWLDKLTTGLEQGCHALEPALNLARTARTQRRSGAESRALCMAVMLSRLASALA